MILFYCQHFSIIVQYCLRETIVPPNGTLTWTATAVNTEAYTVEMCPVGTEFGKLTH